MVPNGNEKKHRIDYNDKHSPEFTCNVVRNVTHDEGHECNSVITKMNNSRQFIIPKCNQEAIYVETKTVKLIPKPKSKIHTHATWDVKTQQLTYITLVVDKEKILLLILTVKTKY